jgi:ankyrin repeat protein
MNNDECPICLMELFNQDKLVIVQKCNHAFHLECINAWKKNCPLCRKSVILTTPVCCKTLADTVENNHQKCCLNIIFSPDFNVNDVDSDGFIPLIFASMIGFDYLTNLLLNFVPDVDVNVRDALGRTPLIWACDLGRLSVVKLLLKKDADVRIRCNMNKSALIYAWEKGVNEITDLIRDKFILSMMKNNDEMKALEIIESEINNILGRSIESIESNENDDTEIDESNDEFLARIEILENENIMEEVD